MKKERFRTLSVPVVVIFRKAAYDERTAVVVWWVRPQQRLQSDETMKIFVEQSKVFPVPRLNQSFVSL